jgi:hemerythrin-like domain-containing protein
MAEHEVILAVVDAIQREADHIRGGSSADDSRVRQMLDFARNFADRCHHAKEERYYFPAVLVYGGQGARGLIDELTAEHAYGRAVLEEIDYVLREDDRAAEAIVGERLSSYAAMLRRHIRKEDERLYQKAGAFLPEAEERALSIGFERLEDVELGSGFHERYHRLAEELSRSSGRLPDSTRR